MEERHIQLVEYLDMHDPDPAEDVARDVTHWSFQSEREEEERKRM